MALFGDLTTEIPKIPGIMDSMPTPWSTSAALMRRWFAGASNDDPFKGTPDTTTVKMDWLLGFARAKLIFDRMVSEKIWANEAAQRRIGEMMRQKGLLRSRGPASFGNLNAPPPSLRADQVNSRVFASSSANDPLDDLFGALGDFNFNVVVEGTLTPLPTANFQIRPPAFPFGPPVGLQPKPPGSEFLVTIARVGIFIWDKYDFNGSQPLGFWNFKTGQVSKSPGSGFVDVDNGDFRDWRNTNGRGGDYLLFSDLKMVPLKTPDTFVLQP